MLPVSEMAIKNLILFGTDFNLKTNNLERNTN